MPDRQSTPAPRAVNPVDFATTILNFVECGLSIRARADIGAVEIRVRDHDQPPVEIVLAPEQAVSVAQLLIACDTRRDRGGVRAMITVSPASPDQAPQPIKIEVCCHAALRVEPDHDRQLLAIVLAAEPGCRLLLSPEAGWWLSLGIARATKALREGRA